MGYDVYTRQEPLKRYTANGTTFGVYPAAGDVTVNADFAYTQATPDFHMQLRAQDVVSDGVAGVTINSSRIADTNYRGIFEVKPPKALFMGTWQTTNEHYSSTVEGCDATYNVTEGIYWRTKNGYNVQTSKNFNSVAPVLDCELNRFFYYLSGDTASPYWKCNIYEKNSEGDIVFKSTENTYLYTLMNSSDAKLDLMICTSLPTTTIQSYYWDTTDNKWHSYYRPYYGTFFLWETTDNRLQNICRMCDTPIQMNSSLTGSRSSVNLFSVPRQDSTGVVPLRPYFPDGYYKNGIYENNFALLIVENGRATYALKMSFMKKLLAYSGMRFMSSYGNNPDFRRNTSSSTGFDFVPVGGTHSEPFTPDDFIRCSRSAIGELNENSRATGRFIYQSELENYHGKNMDNDFRPDNSGYKPEHDINVNDDIDNMLIGRSQTLKGFVNYFGLTTDKLQNLINAQVHAPEGFDVTKSFVSLYQIPFNYNRVATFTASQEIFMNGWNTGVTGDSLNSSIGKLHLGTYNVSKQFDSFLDYEPYTHYSVYVPLCGWIDLPDKVAGNTIFVDMLYDVITLSCEAVVSCSCETGSYVVATKVGSLGSSQTITSEGTSLRDSALHQSKLATIASATGTAISLGTGNITAGMLAGIGTVASITQNAITANKNYAQTVGTTTDTTEWSLPSTCYIKIVHSVPDEPTDYAHTVGRPCNTSGPLSEYNGFTVVDNPDITVHCTLPELNEIKELLKQGIII